MKNINSLLKKQNKQTKNLRIKLAAAIFFLMALSLAVTFLPLDFLKQEVWAALTGNYNKISGDSLTTTDWNTLDDDFLNISATSQSKEGALSLDSGMILNHLTGSLYGLIVENGNVGIGTTNPGEKLDVAGYVKGQTGLCINNDCRTSWPSSAAVSLKTQIFTSSGTWVQPAGVTSVIVTVIGGGGGGGGGADGGLYGDGGGGGGSGGQILNQEVTVSGNVSVTVGSGGSGGSYCSGCDCNGVDGGSGGSSSFGSVTVTGGAGGTRGINGGGSGSGSGGGGGSPGGYAGVAGGTSPGGGCAGSPSRGGSGGSTSYGVGGSGGNMNTCVHSDGAAGTGYGGGGGGGSGGVCCSCTGTDSRSGSGGAGAPGIVIVRWLE